MLACVAIGREVTVAPSGDSELSQVYLYGEAITGLDAFFDAIADEEASGAELADVTLTTLPTGGNQPTNSLSGEPDMVLTFRHDPASQSDDEVGQCGADRRARSTPNGAPGALAAVGCFPGSGRLGRAAELTR